MANTPMKNQPRSDRPEAEADDAPATPSAGSGWSGLSGRQWIVGLLVLWTLINALGFAYFKAQGHAVEEVPSPEIALGDYKFRVDSSPRGSADAVRFSLHVAFTPQLDRAGRERLAARKYRVQQDTEELLRRARGPDFDDPRLRELKRQIQEQINETLGMRAVADVIVTGLVIEPSDRPPARAPTADAVSASEKPHG